LSNISPDPGESTRNAPESRGSAAGVVAFGIFVSRIVGFVREAVVAFFFGISAHTDVFQAAFRAPNLLQNLLGEGTISAAFIPVYSRMIEEGRHEDAGRFAGAIFALLLVFVSVLVIIGVLLARPLAMLLIPGFIDDAARVAAGELSINRFELSIQAIRIIFPMTGVLVLSAWCLGVLNSHRRFFVPYFAPVLWNVAIIAALFIGAYVIAADPLAAGDTLSIDALTHLLFVAFIGALIGGVLQFLVQLPLVFRLIKSFKLSLSTKVKGVMESINAFGPVVAGRGVYQVSAYLDMFLASWLAAGALAALRPAQMLYVLPVSLFGLSVAASELPELSRIKPEQLNSFLIRVRRSMRQTLFLVVPTMVGYIAFGFVLIAGFFQRGAFGVNDTWLVYLVLAGYSIGLMATTISRLLQNSFYALGDTKTPAKIAVLRVIVSTAVAVPLMFFLNQFTISETLGTDPTASLLTFGAVGLAIGASAGAWMELWRLMVTLRRRLDDFTLPWASILKMHGIALLAIIPAAGAWYLLEGISWIILAAIVLALYGGAYLLIARLLKMEEINAWLGRFARMQHSEASEPKANPEP
jgi:putative peptidoglycan lipid II flippase